MVDYFVVRVIPWSICIRLTAPWNRAGSFTFFSEPSHRISATIGIEIWISIASRCYAGHHMEKCFLELIRIDGASFINLNVFYNTIECCRNTLHLAVLLVVFYALLPSFC